MVIDICLPLYILCTPSEWHFFSDFNAHKHMLFGSKPPVNPNFSHILEMVMWYDTPSS